MSAGTVAEAEANITAALADPSVHDAAKRFLLEALDRDIVDGVADADLVAKLLGERADAVLAELVEGVRPTL